MWLVITHSAEARKRHDLRRLRGGRLGKEGMEEWGKEQ
jgi:hypothetical protein